MQRGSRGDGEGTKAGFDSEFLRIPMKPARDSNRKPATDSDLKPAGVPI
jgi:hypothetical protein